MPAIPWKVRIITKAEKYEEKEENRSNGTPIYRIRAVLPDSSYIEKDASSQETKK